MGAIKPIEQSSDKWQRRAAVAGPDYQRGIQQPRTEWEAAARAAGPNYRAAVVAAANAGRFEAGIAKRGNERWKQNALKKGPGRFAEGVALATGDWMKGFQPVQAAFAALQPPARLAKGAPGNIQRVAAYNAAARRAVGKAVA